MIRFIFAILLAGGAALGALLWQSGHFSEAIAKTTTSQEGEVYTTSGVSGDWDGALELDGYYLPLDGNRAYNGWMIQHIFIAPDWQMSEWLQNGQDPETVPVWLDLRHVDSDVAYGEMGAYYTQTKRVRAQNFAVFANRFVFRANDIAETDPIGPIMMAGAFDPSNIDTDGTTQSEDPALTVRIGMDGQNLEDQSFYYYVGH
jgi:hypothetical protein